MKLYFSPLACSLASRIVAYERGLDLEFLRVDPRAKTLDDGSDYREVYPLGLVPALRTDSGELVTENAAVLQYLWRQPVAGAEPAPEHPVELQRWLSFIGTELHKGTFNPAFDRTAPDAVKRYALSKAESRLAWVDAHLTDREFLLETFSPADAYLYTVLNWAWPTKIALDRHPNVEVYYRRVYKRHSVRRAMDEERPLYEAQQAAS